MVNPQYRSKAGMMLPCAARTPGPLTIVNGQAKYTTETGYELDGTVGPNGQLDMRIVNPRGGLQRPFELRAAGQIDSTGTVHARQTGTACSHDFVWQKS
jgi:hypothetical protein